MNSNNQRKKIINSLLWKFSERLGTQGISLIISIVLARSLAPSDFGLIALITVFITIANVFVQSGLGTALIQRKDVKEEDFSTVLYVSLLIASLLYTILYLIAPLIAKFFAMSELIPVIRVLSLTLLPFSLNAIQSAIVIKKMQFRFLFISNFVATIISGTIGITLAYYQFGPWSIVAQQLSSSIIICLVMWFSVKWRPTFTFSFKRLKILFSFGWKLMVSNLINTIYNEIFSLVIGKKYMSDILGFFNRGKQFPSLIVSNIDSSIQTVMLPAYSSHQEDLEKMKKMMRRSIKTSAFLILPAMAGLAASAESFISIILGDKWLPAVTFLQIYCLFYAFQPIQTANLQAFNALGRSDIFLKLEIYKKIIGVSILISTSFFGIYAIALGGALSSVFFTFINSYPSRKLLNYGYKEQMKDIVPPLLLSIIMGCTVFSVTLFSYSTLMTLLIQIVIGLVVYLGLAHLLKLESYIYIKNIIRELLYKRYKSKI